MDSPTWEKIDYGVHEDLRFPVSFLYRALWVLENHGYTNFRKYVDRINMPNQDIERVLNKHKYKTDPEFRDKIKNKLKSVQEKLEGSDLDLDNLPF
jgi:hypothetical protein